MGRKIDLDQKITEIKEILAKYGGIPKQTEDRAAHAAVKYVLKTYESEPQVQELMSLYNLTPGKKNDSERQLNEISSLLKEYGRIPTVKENLAVYGRIRYFFQKNSDLPETVKLKYIYAHQSCFPLPDSRFGQRPESTPCDFYVGFVSPEYIDWKNNVTYEYIEYVYANFQSLPGPETKPMLTLKKNIRYWYRYNVDSIKEERNQLFEFLRRMIDLGCNDQLIKEAYYSFSFDNKDIQERVRRLVIENGACAIHYIAQVAIPECPLDDDFVYYYYYVNQNDKVGIRNHMPLGELYSTITPFRVLRVHYRDYHMCDVDKIRESAKAHYRFWQKFLPETLEDWKYYGQSELFCNKADFDTPHIVGGIGNPIDWSTTYIDKQVSRGLPYFRHFKDSLRYLDYYLYLLENSYTLQDEKLLKYFDLENLKSMDLDIRDSMTLEKILKYFK